MTATEEKLLKAIQDLLNCEAMNYDELDESSQRAYLQARQAYQEEAGHDIYEEKTSERSFVVEVYELYTRKIRVQARDIPDAVFKAHKEEGVWLEQSLELNGTFPDMFGMPTEEISREDTKALDVAGYLNDDIIAGIKSIEEER